MDPRVEKLCLHLEFDEEIARHRLLEAERAYCEASLAFAKRVAELGQLYGASFAAVGATERGQTLMGRSKWHTVAIEGAEKELAEVKMRCCMSEGNIRNIRDRLRDLGEEFV